MHTSRRISRETGKFVRVTPGSQSLERGIRILRAFLEGAPSLSNSELVERVHLPKATVSRLSRSLVDAGMLEFNPKEEAYRLAPSCLSLGRAFQFSRSELGAINGLLKNFARENQINVGLSAYDHLHMVYITTFREGRGGQTRTVAAGLRLPIESCSPGIAFLAYLEASERAAVFAMLADRHGQEWPKLKATVNEQIRNARERGYSQASSAFGNAGVGTTVSGPQGSTYGLNASYLASAGLPPPLTVEKLGQKLLLLAAEVEAAWNTS
ncbi:helix-turn-helix domain-containing protein [Variovorax guangxiensis]|uniref:IclR family transcriptional regulator n=1 Tax=Variovorax guangxiensis TaxID=1775474 RepID=UPI002861A806|nr:helix-turn-helix domain-containing protein [Variovorax guangxiensis]MDR6858754.1 DNA-binding IclR family transcriptional regulator [Variovorax guangxiensis]